MAIVPPFWFKQRQGTAEPAGPDTYRLTAPNLGEAFIGIRRADNGHWSALLRTSADGPEVATTEPVYETPDDTWGAAFELYRNHVVI
jgi:hypothetical protein